MSGPRNAPAQASGPGRSYPGRMGRRLLVYTLLRAAMFALVTAVFYFLARLSLPISVVLGVLVSSLAALVLLRTQRDQLTASVLARREAKQQARSRRRTALDEPDTEPAGPDPIT